MKELDFYQLDRTAQERFVGSVKGSGLPAPILRMESRPALPRVLVALGSAALLAVAAVSVVGYGKLDSGLAIEGPGFLVADVVLSAVATLGFLVAAARKRSHASSPFRHGVYVFPTGLIDARASKLRMFAMDDFRGIFGPDVRGLTVDFEGKSFSFPISDPDAIAGVKEAIESARTALGEAVVARESIRPKALAALDPLQGYANPLLSSQKMTREAPSWSTFAWAIALLAGVVIGVPLWFLRNARSDEAMFARAAAADDSDSYRAYLEHGSRHVAEVTSLLLPRALLHDAEKAGSVEAIEQFTKDHPTGQVAPLAKAALRTALLTELAAAKRIGTLAALADFAQRHDHSVVDPELTAARHGVYQAAIAHYLEVAADRSSPAAALVQRLVAWSEAKGPRVDVRFHGKRSKTLDKADRAAGQSRQFKGVVSLPSHYFDDAAEKADRDALLSGVAKRFQDVFPPEILELTAGDAIADPDAALPAQVAVPTLFIELGVVWAGSIQASQKPRGVFVGVDLTFDALFRTPDAAKPVTVKTEMWRVPDVSLARDAERPEEVVYAGMRGKAFEQFQKKLLGTFFASPN